MQECNSHSQVAEVINADSEMFDIYVIYSRMIHCIYIIIYIYIYIFVYIVHILIAIYNVSALTHLIIDCSHILDVLL